MNQFTIACAATSALTLAAIALSLFALFHSRAALRGSAARAASEASESTATLQALQTRVDALSAELRELQQQPVHPPAAVPRAAMNLGKRSQALRMHRRGEAPAQIAAALELPLQEVDLLLKVHRIVISNI